MLTEQKRMKTWGVIDKKIPLETRVKRELVYKIN